MYDFLSDKAALGRRQHSRSAFSPSEVRDYFLNPVSTPSRKRDEPDVERGIVEKR